MKLETRNLIIRPLKLEDIDDFYDYASNENVGNSSTWKPHESLEESFKILSMFVESGEYFAVVKRQEDRLIGILGLHPDPLRVLDANSCRELGYGLNYNYWNRGYMTEAARALIDYMFKHSSIDHISAYTSGINKRSQRVIEKLGFKKEGVLAKAWINYRGQIHDRHCYFLSKD